MIDEVTGREKYVDNIESLQEFVQSYVTGWEGVRSGSSGTSTQKKGLPDSLFIPCANNELQCWVWRTAYFWGTYFMWRNYEGLLVLRRITYENLSHSVASEYATKRVPGIVRCNKSQLDVKFQKADVSSVYKHWDRNIRWRVKSKTCAIVILPLTHFSGL